MNLNLKPLSVLLPIMAATPRSSQVIFWHPEHSNFYRESDDHPYCYEVLTQIGEGGTEWTLAEVKSSELVSLPDMEAEVESRFLKHSLPKKFKIYPESMEQCVELQKVAIGLGYRWPSLSQEVYPEDIPLMFTRSGKGCMLYKDPEVVMQSMPAPFPQDALKNFYALLEQEVILEINEPYVALHSTKTEYVLKFIDGDYVCASAVNYWRSGSIESALKFKDAEKASYFMTLHKLDGKVLIKKLVREETYTVSGLI